MRAGVSPVEDRSESYTYDNLYRVRSAKGTWGKTSWAYSASGNLMSRTSTVEGQNAKTIEYGGRCWSRKRPESTWVTD